jgi:hypothetical protein
MPAAQQVELLVDAGCCWFAVVLALWFARVDPHPNPIGRERGLCDESHLGLPAGWEGVGRGSVVPRRC